MVRKRLLVITSFLSLLLLNVYGELNWKKIWSGTSNTDASVYAQCKRDFQVCKMETLMDSVYKAGRYNGVLLVAENGSVVYKKAFGKSSFTGQPFAVNTPMQLASVSKPFTATAILMLVERGKLHYNDDIKKFFPNIKYKGVTVKHLLQHTSGIPDYINTPRAFRRFLKANEDLDNERLISILSNKYAPRVEFPVGQQHKYSNTGYALLGSIIEKASGMTYESFLNQNIFVPLGMTNTFCYSSARNIRQLRAKDYREGVLGDKGIFSTVEDMLKWDKALYGESLIKQSTLAEAFAEGATRYEKKFKYGYGWRINNTIHAGKIIFHKGYWQGVSPVLMRIVDCNRTIISLHEAQNFSTDRLVNDLSKIMNKSESFCANYH